MDDLPNDEIEAILRSIWNHCQCMESKRTDGERVDIGYNLSVSIKYIAYI